MARRRQSSAPTQESVPAFFADYPRFLETSETSPELDRLELRYHAIFRENADLFAGARVLDIASHDGRWSFAALQAGAREVVGIEARSHLVDNANATFAHYGIAPDRHRFICGDVFDVLGRESIDVDVVLCLGYLYHTLRYNELMRRIRDLSPQWLVVDTQVTRGRKRPMVRLVVERAEREGNAVLDPWSWNDSTLVGWPNVRGLDFLLHAYDFDVVRRTKWRKLVKANPHRTGVEDYAQRRRITVVAKSVAR